MKCEAGVGGMKAVRGKYTHVHIVVRRHIDTRSMAGQCEPGTEGTANREPFSKMEET